MGRLTLFLCLVPIFMLAMSPEVVYSWSNGGFSSDFSSPEYGTHDWIAEHALDWLPSEARDWILANLNWYLYGTELPDNGRAPDGIGDTGLHHIYFSSGGVLTDDSAARRANATFNKALMFMLSGDLPSAAKYAGVMSHYIADMAVFGHVMGANTDWGAEVHHSDYENYVNSRTSSYSSEFNAFLRFDGELRFIMAYDAAVELAYDTTFDRSWRGLTCTWMDRNYNWNDPIFRGRAGESLNLAANYVADALYTLYTVYAAQASQSESLLNFSVSVDPASGSVIQGGNVYTMVTVTLTGEYSSPVLVNLSVSGLPQGASAAFDPSNVTISSGSPSASSTMIITTSAITPTGTYEVAITGFGGGLSRTAQYALTVTAATHTINFQVLDHDDNSVGDATINFTGSTYSHHESTEAVAGSYPLSAGIIPSEYRFLRWETSGNVSVVPRSSPSALATVSGSGSITMRLQRVAMVTFSASGLGSDASGRVLIVDGESYSLSDLPRQFVWEVGSTHTYAWIQVVESITGDVRYRWASASGLSDSVSGVIVIPPEGGFVDASYKVQYKLEIGAEAGKGTTDPSPGVYWFDAGSRVNVTAIPGNKYEFKMWRALYAVSSTYERFNNPTTVWINGPISLVAEFTEAFDYAISLNPNIVTIRRGESGLVSVYVERVAGEARQKVFLSISDMPKGVSGSFVVEADTPPIYTTLTITASEEAPTGSHILRVKAVCGEIVKEALLTIRIVESERPVTATSTWLVATTLVVLAAIVTAILIAAWKRSRH